MDISSFDELEHLKTSFEDSGDKVYREILIFNDLKMKYFESTDENDKLRIKKLLLYHHLRIVQLKYDMQSQIKKQINLFGKGLTWNEDDEPIGMGKLKL